MSAAHQGFSPSSSNVCPSIQQNVARAMRVFRGASLLSRLSVRTISSAVEREANRNPHNAEVQARLLELLVRDRDFQRVRVRVESGLFAVNAAGFDAYTKALAKLGLNDSVSAGVVSRVLEQVRASAPPPSPPPSSQHGFPPTPPGAPQGEPQLVKLAGPIEVKGVRQPVFLTLLRIMVPLALFLYVVNLVREGKLNMTGRREVHKAAKDEKTRLADVIGLEEAKREVKVLVEYLRAPQLFEKNGLEMPKGLLLFGPPGVGKTLLARAS
jgi:ATP-dependent metalloprotease